MLRRVVLRNFKAFERFTIDLGGRDAYLIGPNNAGKSTLIAAIRAGAEMLRIARRLNASDVIQLDDGRMPRGHMFDGDQVGLVTENLRHEFRQEPVEMSLYFSGEAELHARWDGDSAGAGFFWTRRKDINLLRPREVSRAMPSLGLVPVLSPIEHREDPLSESHVRSNLDRRLASRHFRNQLALLQDESGRDGSRFDDFLEFVREWAPEIVLQRGRSSVSSATSLDLYYREATGHVDKEIFWAGDGMQIWLQLLLHVFRNQDADVLVLDEPDVFLHADLQRRLVGLLESVDAQTVTATHSAEVIAEADPSTVLWVSRNRRRALRAPDDRLLQEMSEALGTHFNLRMARALRTRCVLFVEGLDMKVLRELARTLELTRVYREDGVTTIPLVGFDRWEHVDPFAWMTTELLRQSVPVFVVLDRDYRDRDSVAKIETELRKAGVTPHVWARHELENYLLSPPALARVARLPEDDITNRLAAVVEDFEPEFYAQIAAYEARQGRRARLSDKEIALRAKSRADEIWQGASREDACPGKDLLGALNARLQDDGRKALTVRQLASKIRADEIPSEMRALLHRIEETAAT